MLLVASGGRSYPSSTPLSPAASITEKARYGFAAGSGERNSMRVELSLPFLGAGRRTSADSLLRAQQMCTGASYPAMSRLYEFTVLLVIAVISRAWVRIPAMKQRPTFDRPNSSPGSWNALTSPSNSDTWVCMPEPNAPSIGLGMNVAYT